MYCPKCGKGTRVWKTEKFDKVVERTRVCSSCLTGFKTEEKASEMEDSKGDHIVTEKH